MPLPPPKFTTRDPLSFALRAPAFDRPPAPPSQPHGVQAGGQSAAEPAAAPGLSPPPSGRLKGNRSVAEIVAPARKSLRSGVESGPARSLWRALRRSMSWPGAHPRSELLSSRGQSCSPSSTQLMSFKPSSLEEEELYRSVK